MINPGYVNRLMELSVNHLNCTLDDNEPGFVPIDLKVGSYRWFLYMFSNMYKIGEDTISSEDKDMFLDIAGKFKIEHLISWTRDTLIEVDNNKLNVMHKHILFTIRDTVSFFELKVCVYLLRNYFENWLFLDPFILKIIPDFKEYQIIGKV